MYSVPAAWKSGPRSRLAVVVIHGMGEQEPMETLRGFVRTVWEEDATLFEGLRHENSFKPCHAWSEPDGLSGSMELRRITTRGTLDREEGGPEHLGVRADFFELHWADLTADSTWGDFGRWFMRLLMRRPRNVPPRLFFAWVVLWIIVLVLLASLAAPPLLKIFEPLEVDGPWLKALLSWKVWTVVVSVVALVGWLIKARLTAYLGDVARYVSAAPRNIKVRKDARERGLKLLKEITEAKEITEPTEADSQIDRENFKYDRIVIVGHSLGSILAHDLIWLAWNELSRMPFGDGTRTHTAVQKCELTADKLLASAGAKDSDVGIMGDGERYYVPRPKIRTSDFEENLKAYRLVQRELFRVLASGADLKKRWLISDLVTVGSPLTHASLLVARDGKDLDTKVLLREVLHCPLLDNDEDMNNYRFSYQLPAQAVGGKPRWQLHHGSAMGPVRWTNIYDASEPWLFLRGDIISGPLSYIENSPNFGPGIVDVKVTIKRTGWLAWIGLSRFFTHTQYWTYAPNGDNKTKEIPAHVIALRDAINVLDDEDAENRLQAGMHSSTQACML